MTSTIDPAVTGAGEPRAGADHKGLKDGALGLLSNTVIAIASVAPAYSLAAALGFVIAYDGFQSPVVLLLAFVPMACVAVGYGQLNRVVPDCGTTFTWGTKAFGPWVGWMGGWGIIAADVIVMANLAQIAGQYMFQLFGAYGLANSKWWTLGAGVAWIVVMAFICYVGIEISARVQYGLLAIELTMLAIFSSTALGKVYGGSAGSQSVHPAASWFNPFHLSFSNLNLGLLLALFIYWGWDTAVSVNEETKDRHRTPGRAALISTVVLLVTYVLVSTAAQSYAGIGDKGIGLTNPDNSGDVLSVLGGSVFGTHGFGWFLAKLLVLMVLSSAAASTLTTILPTARTSLAMAAYRSIPQRFARIHRRYLTPTWSTVGMALVSIAFYVVMTIVSQNILGDTISSLGLMIAFYYGLTGFACAWYYRRNLSSSPRNFFMQGVIPGLGGLILFFVLGWALRDDWLAPSDVSTSYTVWDMPFAPHWHIGGVFLIGVVAFVVGIVLMIAWWITAPAFFRGEVLHEGTPTLVPDPD
ncbi:MAG TPA: APC family permease, partial [Acidimicrobiales bacterium]|nr:APC family permease [Acidimicrobiales bacterium]